MSNLITIIEEREKEFDKKFPEVLIEKSPYEVEYRADEFKSHNRQTILKLVEGLEKWAEEHSEEFWGKGQTCGDVIFKEDLAYILKKLKNSLLKAK